MLIEYQVRYSSTHADVIFNIFNQHIFRNSSAAKHREDRSSIHNHQNFLRGQILTVLLKSLPTEANINSFYSTAETNTWQLEINFERIIVITQAISLLLTGDSGKVLMQNCNKINMKSYCTQKHTFRIPQQGDGVKFTHICHSHDNYSSQSSIRYVVEQWSQECDHKNHQRG